MEDHAKQSQQQVFKFLLSMLTGNLGSSILTFIIGLLILKSTDSAIQFGISQVIGPLVALLLLPFTGSMIDKFDKKKVLIAAQYLSIGSLAVYSILIYFQGFDNLIYTYVLLIFLKISDQFLTTGFTAAIITMVIEEHIQKLKSFQQMLSAFIMILSPLLGVMFVNLIPLYSFVLIEIGLEIIAVLAIYWINFQFIDAASTDEPPEGILLMFKKGLSFVGKSKKLIFTLFFSMMINFLFGAINVGIPFVQINVLHFPTHIYGITEAILSIGMILAGLVLSIRKAIKHPLLSTWWMINMFGLLFILLGVFLSFQLDRFYAILLISSFNFLIGAVITWTNVPLTIWMTKEIPIQLQGRTFHLLNTGGQLLAPLGILLFSVLFDFYASFIIFIIAGICILLITIIYPAIFKIDLRDTTLLTEKEKAR